mmetsp:Transcript_72386/g.204585  ORF Transcript_72386/g.204585 Transcript_72386/m.204585 type:complete len:492 (+) Transcript_72386:1123-2598(+)
MEPSRARSTRTISSRRSLRTWKVPSVFLPSSSARRCIAASFVAISSWVALKLAAVLCSSVVTFFSVSRSTSSRTFASSALAASSPATRSLFNFFSSSSFCSMRWFRSLSSSASAARRSEFSCSSLLLRASAVSVILSDSSSKFLRMSSPIFSSSLVHRSTSTLLASKRLSSSACFPSCSSWRSSSACKRSSASRRFSRSFCTSPNWFSMVSLRLPSRALRSSCPRLSSSSTAARCCLTTSRSPRIEASASLRPLISACSSCASFSWLAAMSRRACARASLPSSPCLADSLSSSSIRRVTRSSVRSSLKFSSSSCSTLSLGIRASGCGSDTAGRSLAFVAACPLAGCGLLAFMVTSRASIDGTFACSRSVKKFRRFSSVLMGTCRFPSRPVRWRLLPSSPSDFMSMPRCLQSSPNSKFSHRRPETCSREIGRLRKCLMTWPPAMRASARISRKPGWSPPAIAHGAGGVGRGSPAGLPYELRLGRRDAGGARA